MEIPGNKDNILNESIQIIRNSWSESTRKTYFDIWKKFAIFAKINKFNIYPPDLFSIMSFMISLSKTAPSSVKTFIAVLSVINNLNGWVSPYKFDAIKRLIKAIEKKRKRRKKVQPFPLKILIYHLENKILDDYKTWLRDGLIVALCVRTTWRAETISEIKLKNIRFKMIENKKYAIFDICKSKTNQDGEVFTYFIDPIEDDKKMCIVTLLKEYLDTYFGKDWNKKDDYLFTHDGKKSKFCYYYRNNSKNGC